MYSNESKGQKFPPNKLYDCEELSGEFVVDAMTVYPEYLTDPAILLCPSATTGNDPAAVFNHADDKASVIGDRAGNFVPTTGVPNTNFYPCEVDDGSCSYLYVGWNVSLSGITVDVPDIPSGLDIWSSIGWVVANNPALVGMFAPLYGALGVPDENDADFSFEDPVTTNNVTVYRLREGIERFMITDINNPAASARAQSAISVSGDWVSTDIGQEFNHAPGGCNFLYMDGHVEFLRYPDKWPVNRTMAVLQSKEVGTAF